VWAGVSLVHAGKSLGRRFVLMRIAVAGAAGDAKVVANALLASGQSEFIGLLDDDRSIGGSQILGCPVIGPIAAWSECKPDVAIAIGDNGRKQLFEQLLVAGATLEPRRAISARLRRAIRKVLDTGAI
jgi:FlaA1/EpsC-like NDP-sugar epimerase